jgi:hypothetical protein
VLDSLAPVRIADLVDEPPSAAAPAERRSVRVALVVGAFVAGAVVVLALQRGFTRNDRAEASSPVMQERSQGVAPMPEPRAPAASALAASALAASGNTPPSAPLDETAPAIPQTTLVTAPEDPVRLQPAVQRQQRVRRSRKKEHEPPTAVFPD